jgi:SAM-dependent methyltransferase
LAINPGEICPLCVSNDTEVLPFMFKSRTFCHCNVCRLIFVNKDHLPDLNEEKQRYLKHTNTPDNEGYVRFLSQIIDPLKRLVQPNAAGLDFGCGPMPVLADILRNEGYNCDIYDPFFFPEQPKRTYDFISATECFEHFHRPAMDIGYILTLLKQDGILAIMTDTWQTTASFKDWHYVRDFTHVSFYHNFTMAWIGEQYGLKLVFTDEKRVYVFRKVK